MGRKITAVREAFEVPPLFYDALSGEFVPKPDSRKRTQTLGRIALTTVDKGMYSLEDYDGIHIPMFKFPLEWAGSIVCTVDGGFENVAASGKQTSCLYGVKLEDQSNSGRYVYIANPEGEELEIWTNDDVFNYSLRLGRGIQNARTAVTSAARDFFNNTTYPINSTQK